MLRNVRRKDSKFKELQIRLLLSAKHNNPDPNSL